LNIKKTFSFFSLSLALPLFFPPLFPFVPISLIMILVELISPEWNYQSPCAHTIPRGNDLKLTIRSLRYQEISLIDDGAATKWQESRMYLFEMGKGIGRKKK
jgi:hypothetical protein